MSTSSFTDAARIAGATRLAEVQPILTRWLWPDRIPLGRVTLLVSDPGLGKSLVALDIAARVTTAAPWPDQQRTWSEGPGGEKHEIDPSHFPPRAPGSVLLLTAEDDLADTVRPRLEVLGADCSRIVAITSVPGDTPNRDLPRAFALNRDLARLAALLDTLPDCQLLVIDPITAYLGDTNEHGNAEVRNLIGALTVFARERNLAVLAISHLRKKEGAAIHRTMGSLAFVAAARAAWILAKDHENPNRRLLLPVKNNLAHAIFGLAFTIETSPQGPLPLIRWDPDPVIVDAECALAPSRPPGRPDEERQHAARFLQKFLSEGPRSTREVQRAADAHGISLRTLRRAFHDLNGEAVRRPYPFERWAWKLPGVDGQNPRGELWPSSENLDEILNEIL